MKCPACDALDTGVKDSRQTSDGKSIKRRRFCIACNYKFTTHEHVELKELVVVKKNSAKRPFERAKILRAISIATRKRPITDEHIDRITDGVVRRIEDLNEMEVPSRTIGEIIMMELAKLDDVSCVRFASVYHDFTKVEDFEEFLKKMRNKEFT